MRTRLPEKLRNGRVQDWDFLNMKSGTRLGGDQEFCAFSLETEMRPEQNFQILNILGPDQARDF